MIIYVSLCRVRTGLCTVGGCLSRCRCVPDVLVGVSGAVVGYNGLTAPAGRRGVVGSLNVRVFL